MNQGKVLVLSAIAGEAQGLVSRLEPRRRVARVGRRGWAGSIAGRELEVFCCGAGATAAEQVLEPVAQALEPSGVVLMGVAGALTPDLVAGDVVGICDVKSVEGGGDMSLALDRAAPGPPVVWPGTAVTSRRILSTATEKREMANKLGLERAAVVDLESFVWVSSCRELGLPCVLFRAVSDELEEDLPLDFETFRDSEGQIRQGAIAREAVFRPDLWRGLSSLALTMTRCSRALADAVEGYLA